MITDLVFIIDESGSMYPMIDDTIGGFNALIEKHKLENPQLRVTTVLFNKSPRFLHNRVSILELPKMTRNDYRPNNMTALLDAIGNAIVFVGEKNIDNLLEYVRHDTKLNEVKALFVVITDGLENSSKHFTKDRIKTMVDTARMVSKHEFLFIGANMDAITEGKDFGFTFCTNYTSNDIGTRSVYDTVSKVVGNYVETNCIAPDWNKGIK